MIYLYYYRIANIKSPSRYKQNLLFIPSLLSTLTNSSMTISTHDVYIKLPLDSPITTVDIH